MEPTKNKKRKKEEEDTLYLKTKKKSQKDGRRGTHNQIKSHTYEAGGPETEK